MRERELWIIGIDTKPRRLTDVCSRIGPQSGLAIPLNEDIGNAGPCAVAEATLVGDPIG